MERLNEIREQLNSNIDQESLWDELDEIARESDEPDAVANCYRHYILESAAPEETIEMLGKRAVEFFNEWYEDPTDTTRILRFVLKRCPAATWAFSLLASAGQIY